MDPKSAAIQFRQVNKWFGPLHVLKDVSLEIRPGEVVVVCGPSGSGKSTLIRCVNRLEPIQSGEIVVNGLSLGDPALNLSRLRAEVGMVFQSFNLYPHMTALQNIVLAPLRVKRLPRHEAEKIATGLLERVGIPDKAHAYPANLSGGQQQRVAIARALVLRPALMLLDEVTSSLDPELVGEVLGLLRELRSDGMTMVIATHEMSFARQVADTVCYLHGGVIHEQGPPEQVLGEPREERTRQFLSRVHA